jgi:hypothetical protein
MKPAVTASHPWLISIPHYLRLLTHFFGSPHHSMLDERQVHPFRFTPHRESREMRHLGTHLAF